jgi:hypothetical protein
VPGLATQRLLLILYHPPVGEVERKIQASGRTQAQLYCTSIATLLFTDIEGSTRSNCPRCLHDLDE